MKVIDLHVERHRRHEAKASRDEILRDVERVIDHFAEVHAERAFAVIRLVMEADLEAAKILGRGFLRQCRAKQKAVAKSFGCHPKTIASMAERAEQAFSHHLGGLYKAAKAAGGGVK